MSLVACGLKRHRTTRSRPEAPEGDDHDYQDRDYEHSAHRMHELPEARARLLNDFQNLFQFSSKLAAPRIRRSISSTRRLRLRFQLVKVHCRKP